MLHPVFAVSESDPRLADVDQRFLNQVLKLLDVDKGRALSLQPGLDQSLDLPPDLFAVSMQDARGGYSLRNLVPEPGNNALLTGIVALEIPSDDLRERRRVDGSGLVREREGAVGAIM